MQEQGGSREEKLEVKRRRPKKSKVQEEPLDQTTNYDQEAGAEEDTQKDVEMLLRKFDKMEERVYEISKKP